MDADTQARVRRRALAHPEESSSDYLARLVREDEAGRRSAFGPESGEGDCVLGLSKAVQDWVREARENVDMNPIWVSVTRAGRAAVYWGQHRPNIRLDWGLPVALFVESYMDGRRIDVLLPFGNIDGIGWDDSHGTRRREVMAAGYEDGNAAARRGELP